MDYTIARNVETLEAARAIVRDWLHVSRLSAAMRGDRDTTGYRMLENIVENYYETPSRGRNSYFGHGGLTIFEEAVEEA